MGIPSARRQQPPIWRQRHGIDLAFVALANRYPERADQPAKGNSRVMRGGSWFSGISACRSAARGANSPGNRINVHGFGFRIIVSVEPKRDGEAK